MTKLYSPAQVYVSAFLGGPLAMIFVLKKNFDALGSKAGSQKTIIWGAIFIALYFLAGTLVLLFTTSSTGPSNYLLPIAYSFAARQIAEKYQMSKQAILDSQQYEFRSNWNVFGISVGFSLAFLGILFLWIVGMHSLGSIQFRAPKEMTFIPDYNNGKEVIVRGWTSKELAQILADFDKIYKDDLGVGFAPEVSPNIDGIIHVRFPHDIPGPQFSFLINYIQYPKAFDLKARSILVVGETVLSTDFQVPDQSLIGRNAVFYVPSQDRDYDLVYVQVGNETFEDSFTADKWKKVMDPRLPPGIASLL
jgi:hypothetical protein